MMGKYSRSRQFRRPPPRIVAWFRRLWRSRFGPGPVSPEKLEHDPEDRAWAWIGKVEIAEGEAVQYVCGCFNTPANWPKDPNEKFDVPERNDFAMVVVDRRYAVGQCGGCGHVYWAHVNFRVGENNGN